MHMKNTVLPKQLTQIIIWFFLKLVYKNYKTETVLCTCKQRNCAGYILNLILCVGVSFPVTRKRVLLRWRTNTRRSGTVAWVTWQSFVQWGRGDQKHRPINARDLRHDPQGRGTGSTEAVGRVDERGTGCWPLFAFRVQMPSSGFPVPGSAFPNGGLQRWTSLPLQQT